MLLLHNANIPILPKGIADVDAILVDHHPNYLGRIIDLGSSDLLISKYGHLANKLNLNGQTVLPSFVDAHIHFRRYSLAQDMLDVATDTLEECLERVAQKAKSLKAGEWILGHGWRQNKWAGGFGNAHDLDNAAPNHPVYLTAASLHTGWANHLALKKAGINEATPDPLNGKIGRNANNQPSGILFELAMLLVSNVIPEADQATSIAAMKKGQEFLWKMGITGIHDFDRIKSFRAFQSMHENGLLKMRVIKNLPVEELDAIVATGIQSGFGDDLLRIGGIKDFADGALGPRTAAMIEAYEGEEDNVGMLLADSEQISEWGEKAVRGGLSMTVHAIGDRANHEVLNAYEHIRGYENKHQLPKRRHRIEHVQIIHDQDIGRLAKMGISASVQAVHGPSDMEVADTYWGDRTKNAYAWKSLIDAKSPIAFGSDAPVESPNPFFGIHAAFTRQNKLGQPGKEGWHPEQKISLREAIKGYTEGPAYLSNNENKNGQIKKGFLADLIILKRDPFEIEASKIRNMKVLATMLGGQWVWKSENFGG